MRPGLRISLAIFFIIHLVTITGCSKSGSKKARSPRKGADNWLIHGQIAKFGFAGGEVVALGLDGMRYRSRIASDSSFGIRLPGNASYAIHFLEPQITDYGVSAFEADALAGIINPVAGNERRALLTFEESPDIGTRQTLRLPQVLFSNTIALGQVDIKEGKAFPSINPALKLDFDRDGINDFADLDDQNDGLKDLEQLRATERIAICHVNEEDHGKSLTVPLAEYLGHIEDGDTLGPCIAGKTSLAPVNIAPEPTLPPPAQATPILPPWPQKNNLRPPHPAPKSDTDAPEKEDDANLDEEDPNVDEDNESDSSKDDDGADLDEEHPKVDDDDGKQGNNLRKNKKKPSKDKNNP